ncbi:MAG: hypothetical protein V1801_02630 [Candidatus Falkowbacteria bacterium]
MASSSYNDKRIINLITFIIVVTLFLNVGVCYAANLKDAFLTPLFNAAGPGGAGYATDATAEGMISLVITTVLSFIGVIFLVLAIYGGYIWMIARGNEQEVEKAKDIIKNSIIGLVVVIAAYGISWYIINALGTATLK